MKYVMKCGHIVTFTKRSDKACPICGCEEILRHITSMYSGLEGRKAKSRKGGRYVKSRWDLPKFKYCPHSDFDLYL